MEYGSIKDSVDKEKNESMTQISISVRNVEFVDDFETKLNNWLRGMNVNSNIYSNIDPISLITSD
jgi:hypothetical protein